MANINYIISNVTSNSFDITLSAAVSGLTESNLSVSPPIIGTMTDSGDNLTYNIVSGTLITNETYITTLFDGGTNTYKAINPLINDEVYVKSVSSEMDSSLVNRLEDNYFYLIGAAIRYPEEVTINTVDAELHHQLDAPIIGTNEIVTTITQKGNSTIIDSDVRYYWNRQQSYEYYSEVVNASKVISPTNPIDSSYIASANEIVARVGNGANPGLGTIGGMKLIYLDDNPVANPYNLTGFIITTSVGDILINKLK